MNGLPGRDLRRAVSIILALAGPLAACNSAEGPNVPEGIAVVSGNDQFATVGGPVANPLVARVVDQKGTPFPGASVSWTVSGGGGTLSDTTSTSDGGGYAAMTYTAGSTPGVATVVATVARVWTVSFTVYVVAPSNSVR